MPDDVPLEGKEGRLTGTPDAWLRWQPAWDAYFVAVGAATAAVILLTGPADSAGRAGATALVVLLIAGHLLIGRQLVRTGRGSRRALAYQIAVVVVFTAAVVLSEGSAFVLFALCGPASMMLGPVAGALVVLALVLVGVGVTFLALAVAAVSILIGFWMSQIIGQSMERAELIRELEETRAELGRVSYEAGRSAERQQLADVLHDTLAQGLSSTLMLMQSAGAALGSDAARARHYLELAEATTRDNLADARALISARPLPEAAPASLSDALGREVERLREAYGIKASLAVDGVPDSADIALNVDLLRLAQEALSNVRKHAGASHVEVRLSARPTGVRLEVCDDGRGFVVDATPPGHGLPLMRRRLDEAGGTLRIDSAPGQGTSVRIEVPA
ncbi:sensor histidine kinase [Paractinoplanes hotanensis]|uniref:Oxygen sensor histidine kinase NreB n=1 Tax=Paractinoplanes hotanensis TaxID=2906497 RepID=A0ABT0YG89_9ACTN|nr:sensor histidine kinase [Actinoplanes hotanensis]MCM4085074.1 sensor histidine kinase [Actinoplanes hotanensis]